MATTALATLMLVALALLPPATLSQPLNTVSNIEFDTINEATRRQEIKYTGGS